MYLGFLEVSRSSSSFSRFFQVLFVCLRMVPCTLKFLDLDIPLRFLEFPWFLEVSWGSLRSLGFFLILSSFPWVPSHGLDGDVAAGGVAGHGRGPLRGQVALLRVAQGTNSCQPLRAVGRSGGGGDLRQGL